MPGYDNQAARKPQEDQRSFWDKLASQFGAQGAEQTQDHYESTGRGIKQRMDSKKASDFVKGFKGGY